MKIISWNVAGLRACLKKGALNFLLENDFDILCLQETKALEKEVKIPKELEGKEITKFETGKKSKFSRVS